MSSHQKGAILKHKLARTFFVLSSMSVPAQSDGSQLKTQAIAPKQLNSGGWQDIGAELVFVQNISLQYISFYWQAASKYGINNEEIVGYAASQIFTPVAVEAYQEKIQEVLEQRLPQKCQWLFECQGQSFSFELVISPILTQSGQAKNVLVMGHLLNEPEILRSNSSALLTYPELDQKLLKNLGRKIRQTLDLEAIWQQTVNIIGEALNVSRCSIMSYDSKSQKLALQAEYCQEPLTSMLGSNILAPLETYCRQAIAIDEPVIVDQILPDSFEQRSVLAVATFDQNQCNGLITLGQCDRHRNWSLTEIKLVRELAEQVGEAIAHATLYRELEQATLAAEEASRLKSEFLASTTHELRTPLNGIIGFLKLILDGMADNSEEQQEFLDQAYHSALHLLNLINDILDIAKIEAGKMELELTTVFLEELFQDVEKFTHTEAENKQLYFNFKIPPTYDQIVIYGNYQRLLQVMLNLVGNAIKFTHEGGIVVSAEIVKKKIKRHEQEFPGVIKISVADTGIGVSLEKQDKLFEKFVQADGSRTKAFGGTGLGLAISQKLVEAMGGKIYFYSMGEGLGSTVTFTVPLNHIPVIKTVEPPDHTKEITAVDSTDANGTIG